MTCVASPPLYWVGFHWGNVSLESFFSRIRLPASILVTILLASTTEEIKKKCTLNVNVSCAKVLMGTLFLRLLMQTGLPFYVIIIFEPCEGLAICREKTVPSILSYFKALKNFPGPGIDPPPPLPHLCSQGFYQLTLSCCSQVCIWVNPENLVLGPHLPATFWAHTHDWPIKNANMFVWPICLKGIRKHTSGDSWVHWGSGLEQGSHCYYLSGT